MDTTIYYTLDDIAARWEVSRRTVERVLARHDDPHRLIARKFGGSVRVRHDDLLDYEEHHTLSQTPQPRKRRAVPV